MEAGLKRLDATGALGALLGAVVAVAWTGPGSTALGSRLLGDPSGSMWRALWLRSPYAEGLPSQSPLLGFPLGAPVSTPSPLTDLLGELLTPALGSVLAHNLLLLSSLVLAGAGAALLARGQGLERGTSLLVAVAYAGSAPLLSGLASSSPELLSAGLLPFVVLGVERLGERPGPGGLLLALVAGVGCVLADLNQLVVLGLVLPIPLLAAGWRRRAALPWLAAGLVLGTLAAWALSAPFLEVLRQAGELSTPTSPGLWGPSGPEAGSLRGVRTLSSLVRPGGLQVHGSLERELSSGYLGWLTLGLALVGATLKTRRWSLLVLVGALVALGPWVPVDIGAERTSPASWWLAAWEIWPLSRSLDLPARALPVASLGLAVLAGVGWERVRAALARPGLARLLTPALVFLIPLEAALLSGLGWPLPGSDLPDAAHVDQLQGPGAVLDWPHSLHGREYGQDLALQLAHGRPIPWDLSPAEGPNAIESNGLLRVLDGAMKGEARPLNEARRGAWVLQQQGVGWLVVHTQRLGQADAEEARRLLAELLPLQAELPNGVLVYRMEP